MTTHIDRLTTEVVPTQEPAAPPSEPTSSRWQEQERLRRGLARAAELARRIQAENFDD